MSTKIHHLNFLNLTQLIRPSLLVNLSISRSSIPSFWVLLSLVIHALIFLGLTGFFSMDGINNNEIITIDLSISSPDISTSVAQKNTNFLDPQPKASSITKDSTPSLSSSPSSIEEAQVPANSDNYPNTIVSQNKASGDMKAVYIADLIRKIEANKIYPYMAKKLRQSGKVVVKLEILKSGQIVSQSVIQSSPHHLLNQAALRLVASLKHVSPIPEELHLESWQVIVPIAYVLR